MKAFLKKNWILLSSLATAGAIIGLSAWRNRKSKFSGFLGNGQNQIVQFTLGNNSGSDQTINLFNPWQNLGGSDNPQVSISPSPAQFNRSLMSIPVQVTSFEVRSKTNNNAQVQRPITKVCIDSSGNSSNDVFIPTVSAYQVQAGMYTVQPTNLVLDGSCYLSYTLGPHEVVYLIMRYNNLPERLPAKNKQPKTFERSRKENVQVPQAVSIWDNLEVRI